MSKKNLKNKKNTKQSFNYKIFTAAIAAAILTILILNFSSITLVLSGAEKKAFDVGDSAGVVINKDAPLKIDKIDTEIKNVCITTNENENDIFFEKVSVSFTDDNFRYSDGFKYNKASSLIAAGNGLKSYISLSSFGKVGTIKIESENDIRVTQITVNSPKPFRFSILLFILIFFIIICMVQELWKDTFADTDRKYLIVTAAAMCAVVIAVTAMIHTADGEPLLMSIPDDVTGEDQYTQLFDAFHKGQLNLDIDYDTERLDALENVYDRSERNKNDLHGDFWDRAYYDGKFYSYFGAAPIFTVYYPVYFVTKKIPSPLLASALLCIYDIVFFSLLYGLFVRKMCEKTPRELTFLGLPALLCGSVILAAASEAQFYFIAVLSGVGWTAVFLYFLYSAYYCDALKKRVIMLVCAGMSVVLIVASRPTLLLYCFVGIIPALQIFKSKKESSHNKIIYASAVGIPVAVGAIIIMIYNSKRFGSPFEFGFNYQLTVSRAEANTTKLSMIPPAIYHYFFQQPDVLSSFPYIGMRSHAFDSYTRYNYAGKTMGILNYPVSWGMLLIPFVLKGKKSVEDRTLLALAVAAPVMSFIDMCKAGSHYRYTTDIAFSFLLVSIIVVFRFLDGLKERSPRSYAIMYGFTAAAMLVTIVVGVLLVFANEGNTMIGDYPGATHILTSFL